LAPLLKITSWPECKIRHNYPLAERNAGVFTALKLTLRAWPYSLGRFIALLLCAALSVLWLAVTLREIGTQSTRQNTIIWLLFFLLSSALMWRMLLRYLLRWIENGHLVVLTELLTNGQVNNGAQSMFAYGLRVVRNRFFSGRMLFALQALTRRVLREFHRTLDWTGDVVPLPPFAVAFPPLSRLCTNAATHYIDKAILSYDLARNDSNPYRASRDGLVYYCQSAKPLLKTATRLALLDLVLTTALFVAMLAPATWLTPFMPPPLNAPTTGTELAIAAMLTGPLRGAFIKPALLLMVLVPFHALAEGQAINPAWIERLAQISRHFQEFCNGSHL
jgi:hypothetical protein